MQGGIIRAQFGSTSIVNVLIHYTISPSTFLKYSIIIQVRTWLAYTEI